MLKKTDTFVESDLADAAFEDLKRQLAEPSVLATPLDKEPLLLYVQLMLVLLVWQLWLSARRLGRNIRFNGRFTISTKYLSSQSNGIRIGRSWFMGFLWQVGSSNSTFKAIPLQWSV